MPIVQTPYKLHCGKMEVVVPTLEENFFDSCITDPPYGIRFMGKAWDNFDIEKTHDQQSYFNQAVKNCMSAVESKKQLSFA